MNRWASLGTIYDLAKLISKENIAGSFVECGCCNGGAGAMSTVFLKEREYWLFDCFEGLPQPTKEDVKYDNTVAQTLWKKAWDKGDIVNVQELYFSRLHLSPSTIHIVQGLFQKTIPLCKKKIGPICFLHLDGDWYASTKVCIETLYDNIVPGGYILIDDYGHWKGCKKAIDDFLRKQKITPIMHYVDYSRVYFQKPYTQ
jgi:hypothetical protein